MHALYGTVSTRSPALMSTTAYTPRPRAASSADPMASPASFTKSFESRGESRRSTLRKSHPLDVHHCTNGADAEACAISRLVVSRLRRRVLEETRNG